MTAEKCKNMQEQNGFLAKSMSHNVFSLFIGDDLLRPAMHKPFQINGKVYATDGYTLVRTYKTNIDFLLDNKNDPPNCEDVIPEINLNEVLIIEKEMFEPLKTEDEYEFSGKNVKCETCEGRAQVEWEFEHYTRDFDCPVCKGSGLSEQKQGRKTGGKAFGNYVVKVKDGYFDVTRFYKLVKVRDILGGDIRLVAYKSNTSPFLFQVGDCEILLMPLIFNSLEDYDGVLIIIP